MRSQLSSLRLTSQRARTSSTNPLTRFSRNHRHYLLSHAYFIRHRHSFSLCFRLPKPPIVFCFYYFPHLLATRHTSASFYATHGLRTDPQPSFLLSRTILGLHISIIEAFCSLSSLLSWPIVVAHLSIVHSLSDNAYYWA